MGQPPLNDFESPKNVDVKGHGAIQGRAPWVLRIFAGITDFFWMMILYWFGVKFLNFSPLISFWDSVVWNTAIIVFFLIQIKAIGGSIGQRVWGLEKSKKLIHLFKAPQIRFDQARSHHLLGWLSMIFSIFITIAIFKISFFGHPLFYEASELHLSYFIPKKEAQKYWVTLPFFYTLGAWPKNFSTTIDLERNRPVLYTIPYEKGPPKNFAGKIIARWELPDILITIEGPKTPLSLNDLGQYKSCILDFKKLPLPLMVQCAKIREKVLHRHLSELAKVNPVKYKIQWVEIANPHIQPAEWVRGIFLTGIGKRYSQDRMILITPNGAHQTFILNRPSNERGELALKLFKQTLGTMRVSSKLRYGRALVNRKLSQAKIKSLKPTEDPYDFMDRLSEIQALLLAKISVDPKNFEAYYHLGGTSYLMFQETIKLRNTERFQSDLKLAQRINDWTACVKPMIQSAYLFAKDIAPNHPNTSRLYSIWVEVQKL